MRKKPLLAAALVVALVFVQQSSVRSQGFSVVERRIEAWEDENAGHGKNRDIMERLNLDAELNTRDEPFDSYWEGRGEDLDLYVDTIEVSMKRKLNNWVSGYLELEYDSEQSGMEVEAARITVENINFFEAYGKFGRFAAIPFGSFKTGLIEDSLTESFGRLREEAGMIGIKRGGLDITACLYNGDVDEIADEDDHLENFSFSAAYNIRFGSMNLDFGASFIDNFADAGNTPDLLATETIDNYVAGLGVYSFLGFKRLTLIAEYLTALDAFESVEMQFDNEGAEPCVWNLEMGYTFDLLGRETTCAMAYQGTNEAVSGNHIKDTPPKKRYAAGLSVDLFPNASWAVEYMYDRHYDKADFAGSGYRPEEYAEVAGESRYTVLTELAFEF